MNEQEKLLQQAKAMIKKEQKKGKQKQTIAVFEDYEDYELLYGYGDWCLLSNKKNLLVVREVGSSPIKTEIVANKLQELTYEQE